MVPTERLMGIQFEKAKAINDEVPPILTTSQSEAKPAKILPENAEPRFASSDRLTITKKQFESIPQASSDQFLSFKRDSTFKGLEHLLNKVNQIVPITGAPNAVEESPEYESNGPKEVTLIPEPRSPGNMGQIAPAPIPKRVLDFQLGIIPTEKSKTTAVTPQVVEEEAYIPVQLARAQLVKVSQDMQEMKEAFLVKLQKVTEHHDSIQRTTKEKYEEYTNDLKEKALQKIQLHKSQVRTLAIEYTALKKESTKEIEALKQQVVDQIQLNNKLLVQLREEGQHLSEKYEGQISLSSTKHQEERAMLKSKYEEEIDQLNTIKNELESKLRHELLSLNRLSEQLALVTEQKMKENEAYEKEKRAILEGQKIQEDVNLCMRSLLMQLEVWSVEQGIRDVQLMKKSLLGYENELERVNTREKVLQKQLNDLQVKPQEVTATNLPPTRDVAICVEGEDAKKARELDAVQKAQQKSLQEIDDLKKKLAQAEANVEKSKEIIKVEKEAIPMRAIGSTDAKSISTEGIGAHTKDVEYISLLKEEVAELSHKLALAQKEQFETNQQVLQLKKEVVDAREIAHALSAEKKSTHEKSTIPSLVETSGNQSGGQVRELENKLRKVMDQKMDLTEQIEELHEKIARLERQLKEQGNTFEHVEASHSEEDAQQAQEDLTAQIDEIHESRMALANQLIKSEAPNFAWIAYDINRKIQEGKDQWALGKKEECYRMYHEYAKMLLTRHDFKQLKDEVKSLKESVEKAEAAPPNRGAVFLRQFFDGILAKYANIESDKQVTQIIALDKEIEAWKKTKSDLGSNTTETPAEIESTSEAVSKTNMGSTEANPSRAAATRSSRANDSRETSGSGEGATSSSGSKLLQDYKQKLKTLENKSKADKVKITQLEAALAKAEAGGGGGRATSSAKEEEMAKRMMEKQLADLEKRHKAAIDETEKQNTKIVGNLSKQLEASQSTSEALTQEVKQLKSSIEVLKSRAAKLASLEEETESLRKRADEAEAAERELSQTKAEIQELEEKFRTEQGLRKKYYNMIEDMKGKIRVYARCRPMSSSETDRGNKSVVKFLDEYTLELDTPKGPKQYSYDQVFNPSESQEQVFKECENLMQSALDGYNVCIFAYGQTGSGKTFTMAGNASLPGLTPRAISLLFKLAEEGKANNTVTFRASMLEIYNDKLNDLMYLIDNSAKKEAPKLEIKKNDKGMVMVQNAVIKDCDSAQYTLELYDQANKNRAVGSTKMNSESSRSHSIFSILVESYDKITKKTSIGKLSLVDLAGSERAGKTGASGDQLKEAQAINKSLSALGDVISALSTNEKFIPYRNNKLTQLMQDSLGGNAKTLMFVNISPADYNTEETQTSLTYASRVKLITNNANKNAESEEVAKLKRIIKQLRSGVAVVEDTDDVNTDVDDKEDVQ